MSPQSPAPAARDTLQQLMGCPIKRGQTVVSGIFGLWRRPKKGRNVLHEPVTARGETLQSNLLNPRCNTFHLEATKKMQAGRQAGRYYCCRNDRPWRVRGGGRRRGGASGSSNFFTCEKQRKKEKHNIWFRNLKYLTNYWINSNNVSFRHSCTPQDELLSLWWSLCFSSRANTSSPNFSLSKALFYEISAELTTFPTASNVL